MAPSESSAREHILRRIRDGLRTPAPPEAHPNGQGVIFAPITDVLGRFQAECTGNLTELVLTSSADATRVALEQVLAPLPEGEIFAQEAPRLRSALPDSGRKVRWSSEGRAAEASQATISLCQALVAQTGSILVAASDGGRGASVVAPVHVVVATRDQLVADLETALRRAQDSGAVKSNSFLCMITGSSRTADIEKILVLGAHGPRRVVVILQS
jgi:L-lactate dehydrogenase complex protein LldG